MIVEDNSKPKQSRFQYDWRDPISGVHDSPGSAETSVRRGRV